MEEQSQINKKDMPSEQDLIIVKIYSPFGDLLAGNYEKIQKAIDQVSENYIYPTISSCNYNISQ